MGFNYKFMDNCSYGADDINSIFSKLTTQGISLFNYSDNDNPLISLNDAVNSFITPGIGDYNSQACSLSYTEPDINNPFGKFEILPGNAFMYDGSIITIDENKYDFTEQVKSLRQQGNKDIYVYFYRNVPYNRIDINVTCDTSQLSDQETVLLGRIDSENNIYDKRKYSTTKVAPCSANVVVSEKKDVNIKMTPYQVGADRLRFTIHDIFPGAKYMFLFGQVINIQEVETTTGDELIYNESPGQLNTVYFAVNRVGTDIQFWMYIIRSTTDYSSINYIIF